MARFGSFSPLFLPPLILGYLLSGFEGEAQNYGQTRFEINNPKLLQSFPFLFDGKVRYLSSNTELGNENYIRQFPSYGYPVYPGFDFGRQFPKYSIVVSPENDYFQVLPGPIKTPQRPKYSQSAAIVVKQENGGSVQQDKTRQGTKPLYRVQPEGNKDAIQNKEFLDCAIVKDADPDKQLFNCVIDKFTHRTKPENDDDNEESNDLGYRLSLEDLLGSVVKIIDGFDSLYLDKEDCDQLHQIFATGLQITKDLLFIS